MSMVWLENSTKQGRLVWMLRYQLTKEYSGQCDHLQIIQQGEEDEVLSGNQRLCQ